MIYDLNDTIAAIGTADSGAARGMVRVSGPLVVDCLKQCFAVEIDTQRLELVKFPSVLPGVICSDDLAPNIPCDLFFWPGRRSYTRQPTAELHTIGSPPLMAAVLAAVCNSGARIAQPGEFTLRAFLAGRLDLTQAEAVLGVIDANSRQELDVALTQLAGGLSQPLANLRENLLQLLAELEAGLDFVDDDVEFISAEEISRKLAMAQRIVAETLEQMTKRADASNLPRVVLVGPPNVGKSSLFNALVKACAIESKGGQAIVSEHAGTTRDYLTVEVDLRGVVCELVDTAGDDPDTPYNSIQHIAQDMSRQQGQQADLRLRCRELDDPEIKLTEELPPAEQELLVLTKSDLSERTFSSTDAAVACSSHSGDGITDLQQQIVRRLDVDLCAEGRVVASTSARCRESLRLADEALSRAQELVGEDAGEELIAAEVRHALLELGRVVGAIYTDDVLDRIFSNFCIGK